MNARSFLVFLAVILMATVWVSPALAGQIHVVQNGETLSGIAVRYGMTVEAIASANGLTNPNLIWVGQRLVIPTTGTSVPKSGTWVGGSVPLTHVVQNGETLSGIAARYGVTVGSIVTTNRLANASRIYAGQRLVIVLVGRPAVGLQPYAPPVIPKTASGCFRYSMRPGDTLWGISRSFGVSIYELIADSGLNGVNPRTVRAGTVLTVCR